MQSPKKPDNERERLAALRALDILDTDAEERFDRVTRVAMRMFNVPMAAVALVDESRQWLKSRFGIDVDETHRDISFCGHTILGKDVFVIPDASQDRRFHDNPMVTGESHVRFYAGCPINLGNQLHLGTLCIIDTEPRDFTEEDIANLQDLTAMVEHELSAIQVATNDNESGISNFQGFRQLAHYTLKLCTRQRLPATLVTLTIDDFPHLNSGEQSRALKALARAIQQGFRYSDVYGRTAEDEFALIFLNADFATTKLLLAKLHEHLADAPLAIHSRILPFDADQFQTVEQFLETCRRQAE